MPWIIIIHDRFFAKSKAHEKKKLGNIPAINMLCLLILNIYNHHKVLVHNFEHISADLRKMYSLVVIIYRQMYDFVILNDSTIRIPKLISVVIKLLYSGDAIRSFSDRQI